MRFELTEDQRDFAESLDSYLSAADPIAAARSWAAGDPDPGRTMWRRLAEQGVPALLVPEDSGGADATPVELVIAMEAIGFHAVPGPWVESAGYLARALAGPELEAIVEGAMATVAAPPVTPYALDAEQAERVYLATDGGLTSGTVGAAVASVDRTRHLHRVTAGSAVDQVGDPAAGFEMAVLATAAQLMGAGERMLRDSVDYVKQRRQFGREIGSYQAIKHQLADVRIGLDFARPLLYGAALDPNARDVSAAKVACGDAAYRASRVGLQVHGAIGYTMEFDLSLWITKVRALAGAWGTAAFHRNRVLTALTEVG